MTLTMTTGLPRTITTNSMPSTSTWQISNHRLQHPLPQPLLVEAVTLKIHQNLRSLLKVQRALKAMTHQRMMPMLILGDAEVDAVKHEAMAVEAGELVDTQRTPVAELTLADAMPELQFILDLTVVRSAMKQHLLIEPFLMVPSLRCMDQPPWLTIGTLPLPVLVAIAEASVVEAANSNSVRPESSLVLSESSPSSPVNSVKAVNPSKRSNVSRDADASQLTRSLSWITLPCLNMILT